MSPRASSLVLGAGLALLAIVVAAIAGNGLADGWRAYTGGAAVVTVRTGAAAGVAAAAMLIVLAAMLLPADPSPQLTRTLFRIVIACAPGIVLLPLALTLLAPPALERRGYRRCDGAASAGQRLFATRWCRGPTSAVR